jgi:hypothetical protein
MFHGWENFYIMAGTAAATLAGLLVAGAVMLLLFIGILDAWDLTLWIVKNRETAHQAAIDG